MTDALPSVTAAEALSRVAAGALLLDVREAQEWDAGHAPEAVFVPLSQLPGQLAALPEADQVMVICRSGNRSRAATEALISVGRNAFNVEGGMRGWQEAGGPVMRDNGTTGTVI